MKSALADGPDSVESGSGAPLLGAGQSFGEISWRAAAFYRGTILALVTAVIAGTGYLLWTEKPTLGPFLLVSIPALIVARLWWRRPQVGLPFFLLFLLQQLLIYGLPLLVIDEQLARIPSELIFRSALSVAWLFAFLFVGFYFGIRMGGPSQPARYPIGVSHEVSEERKAWKLGFLLLLVGMAFQIANREGLIFQLLPGGMERLFPVIRTFADAAATLGALFGGIAISNHLLGPRGVSYWLLVSSIFFLSIADLLLVSSMGLVLSSAVGITLGKGRIPWVYMLMLACLLGFLNQSKFEMRNQYWEKDTNSTNLSIMGLPALYSDWFSLSTRFLFDRDERSRRLALDGAFAEEEDNEAGQSILDRVDNFNILVFSVAAVGEARIPVLKGATYTMVPKLLIPRFLWPGKPRTHAGQILLNLHFKRQFSEEETQRTYIAWGALPEAIGNFGVFLGPAFLGVFLGLTFGFLEKFSLRKSLFSIEGFLLVSLLLKIVVSYEMVASVFLTSTFQMLVVVFTGCVLLRIIFPSSIVRVSNSPARAPARNAGSHQLKG